MPKQIHVVLAVTFSLAPMLMAQQSLGDAARELKKNKPEQKSATKVYNNENLPTGAIISVVGAAGGERPTAPTDASKPGNEPKAAPKEKPKTRDEIQEEWLKKIDDAKKEVARLEEELDKAQRQARGRVATYSSLPEDVAEQFIYADIASIRRKQQALDDANQKLEDLKDSARKAGVPTNKLD